MNVQTYRVGRNFALLSIAQVAGQLFTVVLTIYLSHVLLADGFGMIVFATSVLAYASLVIDFGFNSLGPREVAREQLPLKSLVQTIVGIRLLLVVVAFGLLVIFVGLASISNPTKIVILLYGLSLLANALDLTWVFQGAEVMHPPAVAEVFCQVLLTVGALLVIREPEHVVIVPLIFLAARLISVIWLLTRYINRFGWFWPVIDKKLFKHLFRQTMPFVGSAVVGNMLHNFDLVLIGLWLGLEAAGLYGAAYRLVWVPTLLAMAYFTALNPSFARAYVQGFNSIEGLLLRSTQLTSAAAVGLFIGGFLLARQVFEFIYGAEYQGAVWPFQVLLAATALLIISRPYRGLLISFNRQVTVMKIMIIAAITNVVLNIILIYTHGVFGAALATLVAEFIILVLSYVYTQRFVGRVPLGRHLIKPGLSAVIMAFAIMISARWPLIARIAIGSGVYLIALMVLRVIILDEIRAIISGWLPAPTSAPEPKL